MLLLLDNFDSFTYNLVDYFARLGQECHVVRNNIPLADITRYQYDAVVLSPGPQSPCQAGVMMEVIDFYHQKLPMLGICLGHQAIGEFFGMPLGKANKPMHGKLSRIFCKEDSLFEQLPTSFEVVRYHSLILKEIRPPLEVIATTSTQEIMAIRHKNLPIKGVQFHPEAILTQYGIHLLSNWVNFSLKKS